MHVGVQAVPTRHPQRARSKAVAMKQKVESSSELIKILFAI